MLAAAKLCHKNLAYSGSLDRIYACFPMLVVLLRILASHQNLDGYFTTFKRLKMLCYLRHHV